MFSCVCSSSGGSGGRRLPPVCVRSVCRLCSVQPCRRGLGASAAAGVLVHCSASSLASVGACKMGVEDSGAISYVCVLPGDFGEGLRGVESNKLSLAILTLTENSVSLIWSFS